MWANEKRKKLQRGLQLHDCYGKPTFRIKITHNKLTDELSRPRLLSIRASHTMTSVALSRLFHLTPCLELRFSVTYVLFTVLSSCLYGCKEIGAYLTYVHTSLNHKDIHAGKCT
jgi:hypothetical protein